MSSDTAYFLDEHQFAEQLDESDLDRCTLVAEDVAARGIDAPTGDDSFEDLFGRSVAQAQSKPWTAAELPLVSRWLSRNELQLNLIVVAAQRSKYYLPLVAPPGRGRVIFGTESLLPLRSAKHALEVRAMQRTAEENRQGACDDLVAAHRLARLQGQLPTLFDGLIAIAMEESVCRSEVSYLHHAQLSPEMLRSFQAALQKLPPPGKMIDRINVTERMACLDLLFSYAYPVHMDWSAVRRRGWQHSFDWDEALRLTNTYFDQLSNAYSLPPGATRDSAIADLRAPFTTLGFGSGPNNPDYVTALFPLLILKRINARNLSQYSLAMFSPSAQEWLNIEQRVMACNAMVEVAFALADFRADHKQYAAKLSELVPQYLAAIPNDPFGQGGLQYRTTDDGYLIYSVGPNGIDDGGFEPDDADQPGADDIVLRAGKKPASKPKPKVEPAKSPDELE